jgi:hypothetical protein
MQTRFENWQKFASCDMVLDSAGEINDAKSNSKPGSTVLTVKERRKAGFQMP